MRSKTTQPTRAQIAERVRLFVASDLGVDVEECADGALLTEELGADSLDRVELAMGLETEFRIHVADEESEKFRTVGDVIACVHRLFPEPTP